MKDLKDELVAGGMGVIALALFVLWLTGTL